MIPNDGSIDITIQEPASALSLVGQMDAAPRGGQYWFKTVSEENSLPFVSSNLMLTRFSPSHFFPGHCPEQSSWPPPWLYSLLQQHYFKVHAYRVETRAAGVLSVDGEDTPCEDFQVEVHKGMGAFLSPSGRFGVHFDFPAP